MDTKYITENFRLYNILTCARRLAGDVDPGSSICVHACPTRFMASWQLATYLPTYTYHRSTLPIPHCSPPCNHFHPQPKPTALPLSPTPQSPAVTPLLASSHPPSICSPSLDTPVVTRRFDRLCLVDRPRGPPQGTTSSLVPMYRARCQQRLICCADCRLGFQPQPRVTTDRCCRR